MIYGYTAGYYTGRVVTRIVKFYLANKILNKVAIKTAKLIKHHKINSKDPEVVTQNLLDCLEYID